MFTLYKGSSQNVSFFPKGKGRQRKEQRTAIDEEGPSRERISGERTMGRLQRTAIDRESF